MKPPFVSLRRVSWARLPAAFFLSGLTLAMASTHLIYLGGYTAKSTNKGIYAIRLDADTGMLGAPVLAAEAVDPAWITLSPDRKFLYAIHPSAAQAIGFRREAAPCFERTADLGGDCLIEPFTLVLCSLAFSRGASQLTAVLVEERKGDAEPGHEGPHAGHALAARHDACIAKHE